MNDDPKNAVSVTEYRYENLGSGDDYVRAYAVKESFGEPIDKSIWVEVGDVAVRYKYEDEIEEKLENGDMINDYDLSVYHEEDGAESLWPYQIVDGVAVFINSPGEEGPVLDDPHYTVHREILRKLFGNTIATGYFEWDDVVSGVCVCDLSDVQIYDLSE
jgi:hypothetical protein